MPYRPVMTAEAVTAFWDTQFPQIRSERAYEIVRIGPGEAVLRLAPDDRHLRPGGSISGPTLFTLADVSAYAALLAHVGPEPLILTVSFTINFMRRAPLAPLLATCHILKLGRRLAVVAVGITPEAGGDPLAQASGTYSIPKGAV